MCCHKKPTKLTIPLQFLHVVLRCWRHQFCPWSHDKQEQWCDTARERFLAHLPKKQKECLHKQELFEEPGVQKQADSSLSFNNAPSLCISSMLFFLLLRCTTLALIHTIGASVVCFGGGSKQHGPCLASGMLLHGCALICFGLVE